LITAAVLKKEKEKQKYLPLQKKVQGG